MNRVTEWLWVDDVRVAGVELHTRVRAPSKVAVLARALELQLQTRGMMLLDDARGRPSTARYAFVVQLVVAAPTWLGDSDGDDDAQQRLLDAALAAFGPSELMYRNRWRLDMKYLSAAEQQRYAAAARSSPSLRAARRDFDEVDAEALARAPALAARSWAASVGLGGHGGSVFGSVSFQKTSADLTSRHRRETRKLDHRHERRRRGGGRRAPHARARDGTSARARPTAPGPAAGGAAARQGEHRRL